MFLDCSSKRIHVPTTTENDIVFPFKPLQIKFSVDKKDLEYAKPKLQETDIMSSLEKIEESCNKFSELKKYRLLFFFSLGLTCFLGLIVILLVNKGTRSTNEHSDTALMELKNGWFISALVLSGIAFFQNGIVTLILTLKVKNTRSMYEEKLYTVTSQMNEELKAQGIRWKVGKYMRWVEISLDYKKKDKMKQLKPDDAIVNIDIHPEVNVQDNRQ